MAETELQTYLDSPRTLMGIPPELRLEIFDHVLSYITVEIQRGEIRTESSEEEFERDEDDEGPQITFTERAKRDMSELPSQLPDEVAALKLVCRTFAQEIGDSWHSKVTYHFPSTVAFVDVLSQWSAEELRSVRHIHVCDTPFPLNPYTDCGYYTTYGLSDALPMFPGLQLDTLTVENIWLHPNGDEIDGWCLGATYHEVISHPFSKGWKELYYYSGVLGLTPKQQRDVEEKLEKHKEENNEPDFEFEFVGGMRPQLSGIVSYAADGTKTSQDKDEDVKECEQWYADRPAEGKPEDFPDVSEKRITVRAQRGARAKYVHDSEGLHPKIKELMEHMSWVELRATDEYLIDDGLDFSVGHL